MSRDGQIRVVATGSAWVGRGVGSVVTAIEELLDAADDEVQIASYSLGESNGFVTSLENCLSRGIRVEMIVNKLGDQPTIAYVGLRKLRARFAHFELFSFNAPKSEDLHAKILVADRSKAIVGSANPSKRGLFKNHELAVIVSGRAAERIAELVDTLARSSYCEKVSS